MTTEREKIIAAAKECFDCYEDGRGRLEYSADEYGLERFYAIAFEAGRQAEREECVVIAQTPVAGEQDDITMEAKDRIANAIRARSTK